MTDIFGVAAWVAQELDELGFPYCFIGGMALQVWGEPRVTRDVDLTVLTRFEDEESKIQKLVERIPPRIENAVEHALRYRVLLCQSVTGIGVDIGLGGFPYEEAALHRAVLASFAEGLRLRVISAEDLVIMKVFAGRPRDWEDVRGILVRQGAQLNWELIHVTLAEFWSSSKCPSESGSFASFETRSHNPQSNSVSLTGRLPPKALQPRELQNFAQ